MTAKKGLLAWVSAFVAFDVVVIGLLLTTQLQFTSIEPRLVINLLSALITPPLLLLISSLLSADVKAALVFWRARFALPGHRAFSKYVYEDARIDMDSLRSSINPFPEDPSSQNREWYRIYRRLKDEFAVLDANRHYLLFRDLAAVSIFLALGIPLVLWTAGFYGAIRPSAAIFTVQYILSCIAAQQNGVRLVKTVLAIESAQ